MTTTPTAPPPSPTPPLISAAKPWPDNELMELLWQNELVGPPVHRSNAADSVFPGGDGVGSMSAAEAEASSWLFMEEDEMASWLMGEAEGRGGDRRRGFQVTPAQAGATATKQPETTVVRSNATPPAPTGMVTLEEPRRRTASLPGTAERKRKMESRAAENHLRGKGAAQLEYDERREDPTPCASARIPRRLRTAEIHSLSEKRRRERINEKLKVLQELIPRCNKSDKLSTLDEVIEYVKSLQLQVQMMSLRCNIAPLMFPGVQTYLPPMGMGIRLGMGMGLGMGLGVTMGSEMAAGTLSHPVLQFGSLPCQAVSGHSPAQFASRPLSPSFHSPTMPIADRARVEAINWHNPMSDTVDIQSPNTIQIPCIADPYHHFLRLQHCLVQPKNQVVDEAGTCKTNDSPEASKRLS